MWTKVGEQLCSSKRFRVMAAVPFDDKYSWNNLPTSVLVTNVHEEFKDVSIVPSYEFPDPDLVPTLPDKVDIPSPLTSWCSSLDEQSSLEDLTSLDSASSGPPSVGDVSSIVEVNSTVYNFHSMKRAMAEIERLMKDSFESPISVTDTYDPQSGRLLTR